MSAESCEQGVLKDGDSITEVERRKEGKVLKDAKEQL